VLRRAVILLIACGLTTAGAGETDPPGQAPALRVHLPREVTVQGDTLTLGRIAVCRSEDALLVAKAEKIAMGRAPLSGEALVVKRTTVLSRLASCGIDADRVRLSGAEALTVRRREQVVPADKLLAEAEALLQKAQPGPEGCLWRLVRRPEDLPIRAAKEVSLQAKLLDDTPRGHVRVRVAAVAGENVLGATELAYRVMYPHREAVAAADLPSGTVLTAANVTVRTSTSHRPQAADWSPPIGQITMRPVPAGTVLRDSMLRSAQPEVVVQRNQTVVMRIDGVGFTLRWLGLALQDGRAGEVIKVRNVDSRRVVSARVGYDGTVKPVYRGIGEQP
jgi:flagella basal body P-ring formation protein FlgA